MKKAVCNVLEKKKKKKTINVSEAQLTCANLGTGVICGSSGKVESQGEGIK